MANTRLILKAIACLWLAGPAITLRAMPEWVDNALERYLGSYLRRQNERRGITNLEMHMDAPEMVRSRGYLIEIHEVGYPIKIHEVFTEDGYALHLHRLKGQKNVDSPFPRPVVFLQHGLSCSSACWLVGPVDKALAYDLADRGYDVWLGNFRGSTYSRKHVKYNTRDDDYWDFSWDHMGQYDIPAMLQFVLGHTHQKALTYVGHSLGCAAFWVFADTRPELQSSVNVMIALGPTSVMPNMRSPIRHLAPYITQLETIFRMLGTNEFMPNTNLIRYAAQYFCTKNDLKPRKCENFSFLLSGSEPVNFNASLVPVINSHTPAGTSVRTVAQFAQGFSSKRFCRYDWGKTGNQARYGQDTPPEYNLGNVKVPVILFYGDKDWLVDTKALASRLGNLQATIRVAMNGFNHMDFMYAKHVYVLVNHNIRNLIATHNPVPQLYG